jgi:transcriptional regulator with PAS, ATPase and Fis domain
MQRMRSILWVGGAERLREEAVADAPLLDVAWARDAEDAAALPLAAFDALVVDSDDANAAHEALRRLRRAGATGFPPILVRLPDPDAEAEHALRRAGAAAVAPRPRGPGGGESLPALLARVGPRRAPRRDDATEAATLDELDERPAPPLRAALVARSPAMRAVLELASRAMRSHATVLLTGETGTGKELLARAIHDGSTRRTGPFVALNCAAFPDTLLESELFGALRGSYTGADRDKKGLFEAAEGGTLFLDEVGETSPPLQAKLLRALQEREVRPLGAARPRRIDVRVVAATNRSLQAEIERGAFREDLYWRLAVFHVAVPPLRERREDVVPLAEHFLRRHGARDGKPGCRLAPDALDLLRLHVWPGNVRELENEMQRALALVEAGEAIGAHHLSERVRGVLEAVEAAGVVPGAETLRAQMTRLEAWVIRCALAAQGGRRAATARRLGITREGLYKKMKRLGID